jgi:Uma2 family endonuclease
MSTANVNPIAIVPSLPRDEPRSEIVDGVLKEKPPMGFFANILASFLATSINTFALPKRLGMAINETAYQREAKNTRRPDVSYFELAKFPSLELLRQDPPVIEREPNLAIEVVSPSNTIAEMDERIAHFFKTGVQLVWVVHPQSKQVCIYQSTKDCKILEMGDVLDGGKVLPGFSLPLTDLFNLQNLLSDPR